MAHFVRPLALADSLDTSRYDVHFYAPSRFSRFLKDKPFAVGELRTMPGERFLENTARGAPVFPADVSSVRWQSAAVTRFAYGAAPSR